MLTCKICRQTKNEYYTIHNHTTYYCPDCYKFEKESTERRIRQLHERFRFYPRPDFNDDNAVKRANRERQSIKYDIEIQTEFLALLNRAMLVTRSSLNEIKEKKDKEKYMKSLLDDLAYRISQIKRIKDIRIQKEFEEQKRREEEQRRKQQKQQERRRKQEEQRRKMQEESRKRAEEKNRKEMGCIKGLVLLFAIALILLGILA